MKQMLSLSKRNISYFYTKTEVTLYWTSSQHTTERCHTSSYSSLRVLLPCRGCIVVIFGKRGDTRFDQIISCLKHRVTFTINTCCPWQYQNYHMKLVFSNQIWSEFVFGIAVIGIDLVNNAKPWYHLDCYKKSNNWRSAWVLNCKILTAHSNSTVFRARM